MIPLKSGWEIVCSNQCKPPSLFDMITKDSGTGREEHESPHTSQTNAYQETCSRLSYACAFVYVGFYLRWFLSVWALACELLSCRLLFKYHDYVIGKKVNGFTFNCLVWWVSLRQSVCRFLTFNWNLYCSIFIDSR